MAKKQTERLSASKRTQDHTEMLEAALARPVKSCTFRDKFRTARERRTLQDYENPSP